MSNTLTNIKIKNKLLTSINTPKLSSNNINFQK